MSRDGVEREAARQQALLAAIGAGSMEGAAGWLRDAGGDRARGFAVYPANAAALAERALAAVFGTVQALVGADDFRALARAFWREHPPSCGDLGEWGDAFPRWLASHAAMRAWPYLGDCAALDLARHRCERAEEIAFDAASLLRLDGADPAQLRFVLTPGLGVLCSAWPVATIFEAHGRDAPEPFAEARAALAASRGEAVVVVRRGWRAAVQRVDAETAAWMADLAAGLDLAAALDRRADPFDFGAWLARALAEGWVKGVADIGD